MKFINHIQPQIGYRFVYEVGSGREVAQETVPSFEAELGSLAADIEMANTMLNLLRDDPGMKKLSPDAKEKMRDQGVTINDMFDVSVVDGQTVYSISNDFLSKSYLTSSDQQMVYSLGDRLQYRDLVKYAGDSAVF